TKRLNNSHSVPDLSNLIARLTSFPSGCGGFADIYMGEWNKTRRLKQKVAIKVLRHHAVNATDTSVSERVNKMLRAEIRIWHALDHPNIIKLLGTSRGFSPYTSMILPWLANGSLPSFLKRHKSLIYPERLRLAREVATGLAYLHSHAIIHGDLTGVSII
ncbi:kinase-like domain-containing protein, partial [Phellopilus nigrolimitatus]